MNRHLRRRAAIRKRSLTVHKSGLIGSIAYAQNAASTAIAATTTIAKMMALRLPIAVRCPQSGHLATSWSKSTPQAVHLWRSGCRVDSGSAGIAGGYAEPGKGGTDFSLGIGEQRDTPRFRLGEANSLVRSQPGVDRRTRRSCPEGQQERTRQRNRDHYQDNPRNRLSQNMATVGTHPNIVGHGAGALGAIPELVGRHVSEAIGETHPGDGHLDQLGNSGNENRSETLQRPSRSRGYSLR